MEIALVIILIVAVIAVATVFAFFYVLAKILKAAIWGLSWPLRAAANRPPRAQPVLLRGMPVDRRCTNPKCGAGIADEARFCGRCGSAVTAGSILAYEPLPDATYVTRRMQKRLRKGQWRMVDGVIVRPTVMPPRRCRMSRVA